MLGDPHFFFGRPLPFLALSIILKNKKNLCVGSFNYSSYTIKTGSNWYVDTGVRDLEVVFFVSFPQKRNVIVFSSGVNYLHSGGNIQSE